MNSFNCEMTRACKSCLDLVSEKKTFSTDINMLKRKPANQYYQMLPYFLILEVNTNRNKTNLILKLQEKI